MDSTRHTVSWISKLARHRELPPLLFSLLGVAASLLAINTVPVALLGAALLVTAVGSSVIAWRGHLHAATEAEQADIRNLTERWPLPTARELLGGDLTVGLVPDQSYLPRKVDETLAQALRTSPFVLVVGEAGSGKTAALFNAAVTVYPDHRILIPLNHPGTLARLIELGPPADSGPLPMLVLLDGLDGSGQLPKSQEDITALSGVLAAGQEFPHWFIVLATMRTSVLAEYEENPDAHRETWDLLKLGSLVHITSTFEDTEAVHPREASSRLVANLGEAAADWTRTGVGAPIHREDLLQLASLYEPSNCDEGELSDQLSTAVAEGVLRIENEGSGTQVYRPDQKIVEARTKAASPIPRATWRLALSQVTPGEALWMAHAAFIAEEQGVEEEALLVAYNGGNPEIKAQSAARLGNIAHKAGDYTRAAEWLERGLETENLPQRERAAYQYASAVAELGRYDEAEKVLSTIVAEAPTSHEWEVAAILLAELHEDRGAFDSTEKVLRRILAETDNPTASYKLGMLLLRRGDKDGAHVVLELAARRGHVKAMNALGEMEAESERLEQAEYWYRGAAQMGSASAALELGNLLADLRPDEAEAWLVEAMERSDPDSAAAAALRLGRLTQARGNSEAAAKAFQRALDYAASTEGETYGPSGSFAAASKVVQALEEGGALDEVQISSAALLSPGAAAEALNRLTAEGTIEVLPGTSGRPRYTMAGTAETRRR